MVLWLIGMSGAGKTVVGREVVRELRKTRDHPVFLDGDVFRSILGDDIGHTIEDRKKNADRFCRMCAFLDGQGVDVVCAILSIFHESQQWNREHLSEYFEVYLRVSFEELLRRDSKGLYGKARRGEIDNVVGVDIPFPEPLRPDLVIDNEGDQSVRETAGIILESLRLSREPNPLHQPNLRRRAFGGPRGI